MVKISNYIFSEHTGPELIVIVLDIYINVDYMNIKNQWCYDIRGLIRVTPKFIVVSTKGLL